MHLVTGYAGKAHVTAADQGAFNAAVISSSNIVLPTGERFRAEKVNDRLVQINSGDALMGGRHVNIPYGQYERCVIDDCSAGFSRSDIIAIRYEKNTDTLVESARLVVLKGVPSNGGELPYPDVEDGDILKGDVICEFPLYQVQIVGEEIINVKQLFRVTENIAQMNEIVSQISETMDTWADISQEDVDFEPDVSHVWGYVQSLDSHLARRETEADGGKAKSAKIAVKPGETYKVTADRGYYTEIGGGCPLIATVWAMTDGGVNDSFGIMRDTYHPLKNSDNVYLVTVPANCTHLLINSCSDTLGIKKVISKDSSGGAKILWSGLLKGNTISGSAVDFTIPESCFFNGGKELILAVNGYCPDEAVKAYGLCLTGLCFGNKEDFGITDNTGAPYNSGEFYRGIYQKETVSVEETSSQYLIAKVLVKKVPDNRYAVCKFVNSSPCFYITSISAIIAG